MGRQEHLRPTWIPDPVHLYGTAATQWQRPKEQGAPRRVDRKVWRDLRLYTINCGVQNPTPTAQNKKRLEMRATPINIH